ncbi:MAG: YfbK domain-containing protein, partial [Desulfobulbia bacterium]
LLATDGDFNVGISDVGSLKQLIERQRKSGIYLSVLGFGRGNYNDAIMQTLAQNGNGTAAYIDNLREAQKVLVQESSSTLFTIAKDVKIQIEFNPKTVSEYRLIGYETRFLNKQDFKNDKVDAGDIGSGHTVTAIFEITPANSTAKLVDNLRYQKTEIPVSSGDNSRDQEYAFLKMRYKLPGETKSRPLSVAVTTQHEHSDIDRLSDDVKFSASVAAFGQKLRGSSYLSDYGFEEIISLAGSSLGQDKFGYRHEFLGFVRLAKSLEIAGLPSSSSVKDPK